ncbi:MAG: hypothetical protein NTV54_14915 [Ignavibacteriales bacterium]|nr:hypothetical protein [Ignavibacteriales bacterium]
MAKAKTNIVAPAVVITLVLGALGYYWYSHRVVPPLIPQKTEVQARTVQETVQAFLAAQHSPLAGKVTVGVPVVDGDYARVTVIPNDSGAGDSAIGFLHKQGSLWEVIAIGTVFEPEFYAQHSIPRTLQL